MIRFLLLRRLRAFGRRFDYDVTYMEEILSEDLAGFLKFYGVTLLSSHGFGLPKGPLHAAKFVATRAAGCGPCVQLVVALAAVDGVVPEDLARAGREGAQADPDMRLAAHFAQAVVDQAPDLPLLAQEVQARWGRRGLIGLAAAIATAQFYPMMKRAMGHAQSCDILPEALRATPVE
ncbi:MAG TPA: hypothetical protein PK450_02020 [Paracoccaceae bacterium]|nr:hypothetical protein [Paracoccaceae bacterium]